MNMKSVCDCGHCFVLKHQLREGGYTNGHHVHSCNRGQNTVKAFLRGRSNDQAAIMNYCNAVIFGHTVSLSHCACADGLRSTGQEGTLGTVKR